MDSSGAPSRTAMMAATSRAWHLLTHGQRAIFADWLAWPLVGADAEKLVERLLPLFGDTARLIATWLAARQRFTEDWLGASSAEQYVVLGAGLDSFAWRSDTGMRIFEVDHPSTQAWKRGRVEALRLEVPDNLTWVPVDFESESFADRLRTSGLETRPTFVSWQGVTPYLTVDAIGGALDELPPCSLAVSYGTPDDLWDDEVRRVSTIFRKVAADAGEPILSLLSPDEMSALLDRHGFTVSEDVGHEDVQERFGIPALANGGERLALATKSG